MKILITGINGLLGTELARALSFKHEVSGISRISNMAGYPVQNVDITDQKAVYDHISRLNPDMVIHSAALSNVDECEEKPEHAYRVNALGTRNIALACQRFDSEMIYISTDYVFSGKNPPAGGYREYDETDPLNEYAKSKLQGEWFVRNLLNRFYIVRVSWLYGAKRSNFVTSIAESFKNNRQVKAVTDMVSAPTYVADLAGAIAALSERSSYGIYHVTNEGFASRYEIAREIAAMMGAPEALILKMCIKDINCRVGRPAFSGMCNYALKCDGQKLPRPWREAMKEFLSEQGYL